MTTWLNELRAHPRLRTLRRVVRRTLGSSTAATIATERPGLDALIERGVVQIGRRSNREFSVAYYPGDTARLIIGSFCSIAAEVEFIPGGNHRLDWVANFPVRFGYQLPGALNDGHPASKGDIVVGNDVWIGRGARIMSGVHIGNGAVVGAGSVVTHDVADYMIAAGNPCRAVRPRFTPEVIDALLAIAWWEWSDEAVVAAAAPLSSSDVNAFVSAYSSGPGM